jgi:hypothetical protein
MTESDVLAYVKASAVAQGFTLDEARAQRVATHMARTAQLAELLETVALGVEVEPAEIFRPKPFPTLVE